MPEGLDKLLKPEEIADLVAYLKESAPTSKSASTNDVVAREIPPHRAIALPGLHAYAQKSIAAGEEIEFRVSSDTAYDLSIVKLGPDPEIRDADPVLKVFRAETPSVQPIHPGSYVHVVRWLASRKTADFLNPGMLDSSIRYRRLAGPGHTTRLPGQLRNRTVHQRRTHRLRYG